MMEQQPTAGILIVVLLLTTVLSFAFIVSKRMSSDQISGISKLVIALIGVAAVTNCLYQVTQVGEV
jgi:multisubunit Na+/H+ antiporter MnhF subunit